MDDERGRVITASSQNDALRWIMMRILNIKHQHMAVWKMMTQNEVLNILQVPL